MIWVLAAANYLEQGGDSDTFLTEHFLRHQQALIEKDYQSEIVKFRDLCRTVSSHGGKMIFAGNRGSASVASHAATDFTKQSQVRTVTFNDHNLMSAFSNDYGQDKWIAQCLEDFADPEDAVVLLSCSGESKNIVNAALSARQKGLPLVTMSGCSSENTLNSLGQLNFWVNSRNDNITEAIHSIMIFCVGDMLARDVIP